MKLMTVRCHVSEAPVTCVTDFEGGVIRVICPAFDEDGGVCNLKRRDRSGGPLSQLLQRAADQTLSTRDIRCVLI